MIAIKKAQKIIQREMDSAAASIFSELVLALEKNTDFALHRLYELDYKNFEIAVEVIKEWRLDRYYASKVKLLASAIYVEELQAS
jgi:flagellar biosynthesis/type III secretory pathway protein FliH